MSGFQMGIYPEGFAFPLKAMTASITLTEVLREAATMIMLAGIGYLSGRNRMQRFGIFLYAFGLWDIFYYVFLKLLIGWPESLLTWDILFLIPVTWAGPVLAPVINALTMAVLGGCIYAYEEEKIPVEIKPLHWALLISGSIFVVVSYTLDYLKFSTARIPLMNLFLPSESERVLIVASGYVPEAFNWWIFGAGQSILLIACFLIPSRKGTQRTLAKPRQGM